jgi:hypothetical protein
VIYKGGVKVKNRTTFEIVSDDDVINIVRIWTLENNFKIIEKSENRKVYKKSTGNGPFFLEVHDHIDKVVLLAWVKPMLLEGFKGNVPRRSYRKLINRLFQILEEPEFKG